MPIEVHGGSVQIISPEVPAVTDRVTVEITLEISKRILLGSRQLIEAQKQDLGRQVAELVADELIPLNLTLQGKYDIAQRDPGSKFSFHTEFEGESTPGEAMTRDFRARVRTDFSITADRPIPSGSLVATVRDYIAMTVADGVTSVYREKIENQQLRPYNSILQRGETGEIIRYKRQEI